MSKFYYTCIVGSPRSGTTLTGRILNRHDDIATWFVPYFVWEKQYADRPHDLLTARDVTQEAAAEIRTQFDYYKRKNKARVVVDQSPRNSLKMGFVREVFPEARFIHVLRDGRDAVLSIFNEWKKRYATFEADGATGIDVGKAFGSLREFLHYQPLLKHKFQALAFETGGFSLDSSKHYYRRRWKGRPGWGPRFPGWDKALEDEGLLECCARQWNECVKNVFKELETIPPEQVHTVRYEDLLTNSEEVIGGMLEFLGCPSSPHFWEGIPQIRSNNTRKWETGFTHEELERVNAIVGDTLSNSDYE